MHALFPHLEHSPGHGQTNKRLSKLWNLGKIVCCLVTCCLSSIQADDGEGQFNGSEQELSQDSGYAENTEMSQESFRNQVETTNNCCEPVCCETPCCEPVCCQPACCETPCCESTCCDNSCGDCYFCPKTDVQWDNSFCFLNRPFNFYLRHTEGRWLDLRRGYTTLGFFGTIPVCNNSCLYPFIDVRGHIFNNGRGAANLGLGLRYLTPCWYVVGFNVFFDYRREDWRTRFADVDLDGDDTIDTPAEEALEEALTARWRHSFEQVGVGFEFLGPYWEFRANGYFPVGNITARSPVVFQDFGGGNVAAYQRGRRSAYGGDLEIGAWFLRQPCCWLDFFGALGTYYFSSHAPLLTPGVNSDLGITQSPVGRRHRNIWGIQGRLQSHLGSFITAEIRAGYDAVYKGSIQFAITLSNLSSLFNFCRSCCSPSCNSCCCCVPDTLYEPVRRQDVIVLGPARTTTNGNFPINPGTPVTPVIPIPPPYNNYCYPCCEPCAYEPCCNSCEWEPCEWDCRPRPRPRHCSSSSSWPCSAGSWRSHQRSCSSLW